MRGDNIEFDFSGRVALVTGAGRGIGRAVAKAFVLAGASVVTVTRSDQSAAGLRELSEDKLISLVGDAGDPTTADRALDVANRAFGRLDILVNNAGEIVRRAPMVSWKLDEWDRLQASNVRSVFAFCRASYAHLRNARPGCVVNVASLASFVGMENAVAYCTSKGGVAQLTRALAVEWGRDDIRVNAVAPGYIETDMNADLRRNEPELAENLRRRVPLARWGEAADVTGPVMFLCSGAASYVTGAVIPVDGGALAN